MVLSKIASCSLQIWRYFRDKYYFVGKDMPLSNKLKLGFLKKSTILYDSHTIMAKMEIIQTKIFVAYKSEQLYQ